jgi:hypothetical protein
MKSIKPNKIKDHLQTKDTMRRFMIFTQGNHGPAWAVESRFPANNIVDSANNIINVNTFLISYVPLGQRFSTSTPAFCRVWHIIFSGGLFQLLRTAYQWLR